MEKIVIGLTGEMLCGKTTAADFLVEHFQARQMKMSSLLNDILDILDLSISRENQVSLANLLRELFGEAVLADALLAAIAKSNHRFVLVDGIRKIDELKALRKIKGFRLIYVTSTIEKRFERLKNRDEKTGEQYKSWEEFQQSHNYLTEIDIPKLRDLADFVVENNGTAQQLYDSLTSVINKIVC